MKAKTSEKTKEEKSSNKTEEKPKEENSSNKTEEKLVAHMTFLVKSFVALVAQQISGFSNVDGVMGTYRRFRIWDREQEILHVGNKLALRYGEPCEDLDNQFQEARKKYEAHLEAKEKEAAEEANRIRLVKRKSAVNATEEE